MSPFFLVSLILFLIWFGLILFAPSTRREQVVMSVVGLIIAPGALVIASTDYRGAGSAIASAGIEDLLFSFALFGIAAVIYQTLLGKRLEKRTASRHKISNPALHWTSLLVIISSIWLFAILLFSGIYGLHVLHAAMVGGLLIGIYVIADRKDLLGDAILSAIFMAVLVFLIEQIFFIRLFPEAASNFWSTESVSGITLAGIPAEELHWAAVVGFTVGPLYEYIRRYTIT